jgi:hypothetical protein
MTAQITIEGRRYEANLNHPQSLAITLSPAGPRAWYVPPMRIEPVRTQHFTGSVAEGGAVNFRDVYFNPHGHGTHTESVGHITTDAHPTIADTMRQYWFAARVCTISPDLYSGPELDHLKAGDSVIMPGQIVPFLDGPEYSAVIIRTLPNEVSKLSQNYSDTNPAYFHPDTLLAMREAGLKHLLTDLPSVDRESDAGLLLGHRAWWGDTPETYTGRTITEMIYVPDTIEDGLYLLNLQVMPWENDAAPSNPVIYKLK